MNKLKKKYNRENQIQEEQIKLDTDIENYNKISTNITAPQ